MAQNIDRISFDRAAEYYDSTRALPEDVAARITSALLNYTKQSIGPNAINLLEIGVGTGRIAGPCLAQGFRLAGIDLSWNMMARLRQNLGGKDTKDQGTFLGLTQADAARLPFRPHSFDAVLAVHVLHLINEWQEAIHEARRVTHPGGCLIVGFEGRSPNSPTTQLRDKFDEILLRHGVINKRKFKRDFSDVDEYMLREGCAVDEITGAEWSTSTTVARIIEKLNQRIWSSTWDIPEDIYAASIAEIKNWAQDTCGDFEKELNVPNRFIWKIYQWK